MDQQLNFRADKDLAEALIAASRREDRSRSSLIRVAIRKYLNESASPARADAFQDVASKEPVNDPV